jgi:hypothetical protein
MTTRAIPTNTTPIRIKVPTNSETPRLFTSLPSWEVPWNPMVEY